VVARSHGKAPAANDVVENFQRTNMNGTMRANGSFIIFINLASPVLTLSIRRITFESQGVKDESRNFIRVPVVQAASLYFEYRTRLAGLYLAGLYYVVVFARLRANDCESGARAPDEPTRHFCVWTSFAF